MQTLKIKIHGYKKVWLQFLNQIAAIPLTGLEFQGFNLPILDPYCS